MQSTGIKVWEFILSVSFSGTSECTVLVYSNWLELLVEHLKNLFHLKFGQNNSAAVCLPCPWGRTQIFGTVDKGGVTLYPKGQERRRKKKQNDKKKSLAQVKWAKVFWPAKRSKEQHQTIQTRWKMVRTAQISKSSDSSRIETSAYSSIKGCPEILFVFRNF